MDTRIWTRRRFLHTAGLAGLAPLATPRLATGAGDWSRDFARAFEANPALLGWRSVEDRPTRVRPHASRVACLPSCKAPSTATDRRCTNASAFGTGTCSTVTAWCRRFASTGAGCRTVPVCSPPRSSCARPKRGAGLFSGFATPVDDGAPVRRADDVKPRQHLRARPSRRAARLVGGGLCERARPARRFNGGASRSGARDWRVCPSPPTRRSSPTGRSGPSATTWCRYASARALSHRRRRHGGQGASPRPRTARRRARLRRHRPAPGHRHPAARLRACARGRAARCARLAPPSRHPRARRRQGRFWRLGAGFSSRPRSGFITVTDGRMRAGSFATTTASQTTRRS